MYHSAELVIAESINVNISPSIKSENQDCRSQVVTQNECCFMLFFFQHFHHLSVSEHLPTLNHTCTNTQGSALFVPPVFVVGVTMMCSFSYLCSKELQRCDNHQWEVK